ncbi:putative glycosyl [Erysiphe neolycopersici]|uniref:Putative glycosyl n=1 Tax=Erysiphe neolycopersici TaxID=212602 RepID=A0A420HZ38_9PEZI|nr:putative glycosyl [Erysiphe neolycopersici]
MINRVRAGSFRNSRTTVSYTASTYFWVCLPSRYRGDESLRDAAVDAVRDVPECSFACYKPAPTFEALCADIRASIATKQRLNSKSSFHSHSQPQSPNQAPTDQLYKDRRYGGECEGEHDVEDEDGDIWDTLYHGRDH